MKKLLLLLIVMVGICLDSAKAETISINGTDYEAETLIQRELGAGVIYKRLRIAEYPLNVNMLFMDMTNPYARIETTQGSETITKTEALANASKRLTSPGHKVLGGANANFWCVSGQQPWSDLLIGTTYSANVRNGVVITETNMKSDQWNGGWKHTGIAAVDNENKVYVGHFAFHGTISNEKIGTQEIYQVNKVCRDNEIAMYNKYYGTDKKFQPVDYTEEGGRHYVLVENQATEVLLNIDPGQTQLCATDITATVQEVRKDAGRGTLGNYDIALIGKGSYKETLAQLQPGDRITLNYGWSTSTGGQGERPKIENAIAGNAMVLINGEYTSFNDSETYNSQIYSRTAYATDKTGKRLAIIVIDKVSDPVYGSSKGCNTKDMCDILKHFGFTEVVNMDAGGSAEMLVEGKIINKTTEGTPRAVANGWFMISTAPEDNNVARLEFDSYKLEAPVYSTFRPVILAYNKYGDIIDHDLQGVQLSCDPSIGTCDGDEFTAAGESATGLLTATYNGISVSKEMNVMHAELSLRIKPILIDATRKYPIEVTASIENKLYTYDPADIEWTVEDPSIASVDANGCLTGLKNGTTKLTGRIGDFSDQTEITVEIAPAPQIPVSDWSSWTATGSAGISGATITKDGSINFNYASPRSPNVKIAGKHICYSLPDKIFLTFTPSVEISKILPNVTAKNETNSCANEIAPESGVYAAGKSHTVEISLGCDLKDLITFPLTINSLTFYINKNSNWKGEQTIVINDLHAEYANYAGVENIAIGDGNGKAAIRINPSPVASGSSMTISSDYAIYMAEIFNISGAKIAAVPASSTVVTLPAPANSGIYIIRISTAAGVKVAKLLVE